VVVRIQENLENSDRVGRLSRALEAGARRQRCVWGAAEEGEVLELAYPTGSGAWTGNYRVPIFGPSVFSESRGEGQSPVCLFSAPPLGSLPVSMPLSSRPLAPLTACLVPTLCSTRLDSIRST